MTIGTSENAASKQLLNHARACLADAEREENSLGTRIDAAVQAAIYLDVGATQDPAIAEYLARKYGEPLSPAELAEYCGYAITLAKKLLSNGE
jgi:hypothetical protein